MKFHLVNNQRVQFNSKIDRVDDNGGIQFRSVSFEADIIPSSTGEDCSRATDLNENCDVLRRILISSARRHPSTAPWNLKLEVGLPSDKSKIQEQSIIRLFGGSRSDTKNFLGMLRNAGESVKHETWVTVTLREFEGVGYSARNFKTEMLFTKKSGISKLTSGKGSPFHRHDGVEWQGVTAYGCTGLQCWEETGSAFEALLDVTVSLKSFHKMPYPFVGAASNPSSINRKILEEELASDVIIRCANKQTVQCHRNFLLAHSDVFENMAKAGFVAVRNSIIELPDMTEESVRGLLEFLYLNETSKAEGKGSVALALYQVGQRCNIAGLEDKMKHILLTKPSDWFDADLPLELYKTARNAAGGDNLKLRAVTLIRTSSLFEQTSEAFQNYFKGNPEGALDLCLHLIGNRQAVAWYNGV